MNSNESTIRFRKYLNARTLLVISFCFSATYHLVGLVDPTFTEPSPPWRHALFAAINGSLAWGVFRRFKPVRWVLLVLSIQQVISHGQYGWQVLTEEHRIDWASVLVLAFLPLLVGRYWVESLASEKTA